MSEWWLVEVQGLAGNDAAVKNIPVQGNTEFEVRMNAIIQARRMGMEMARARMVLPWTKPANKGV